jgi:hypothetical protein
MGYRGRGRGQRGPWPGRGPFSNLPPWERPGWLYGRGSCWYLYSKDLQQDAPNAPIPPVISQPTTFPFANKEQEKTMLENYIKGLETQIEAIKKRLEEIEK